jgi:hypothetical protein
MMLRGAGSQHQHLATPPVDGCVGHDEWYCITAAAADSKQNANSLPTQPTQKSAAGWLLKVEVLVVCLLFLQERAATSSCDERASALKGG